MTTIEEESKRARLTSSATPLSIGRPRYRPETLDFSTANGEILISRTVTRLVSDEMELLFERMAEQLDKQRGCLFQSAYEFPGRYSRWSVGFVNPPIALECRNLDFTLTALNPRGQVLLPLLLNKLSKEQAISVTQSTSVLVQGKVKPNEPGKFFAEEDRSKQNSVFSIVRALIQLFYTEEDPQLGLYGSFGYDLTFQFEPVQMKHVREGKEQRDLVLYLPDEIYVHDIQASRAWKIEYDFTFAQGNSTTTKQVARGGDFPLVGRPAESTNKTGGDPPKGEYAKSVVRAKEEFKQGNLFEVVLSQTFQRELTSPPSQVYRRLYQNNPSPYLFILNLGLEEHLVGASPEMFVRVEKTPTGQVKVETCPISGTIRRGKDAMQDADRVNEILQNEKEKSELTMCTDVDRNDKSRICVPGSVRVVGRRQIEKYSKLIHTVDHVEGYLAPGFDSLDAFLVHTWAVTVSGAPKKWAMQFIENHEAHPRAWYGGAVGILGFDGHCNTGLTIRTVRILNGKTAEVRSGATLLFDSTPEDEEKETELKAEAFLEAVMGTGPQLAAISPHLSAAAPGEFANKLVLLLDHEDSFVHTLANYLKQTGAEVKTIRYHMLDAFLQSNAHRQIDLAVLSPGPGNPSDFNCSGELATLQAKKIPVFGVCLGLQAMIEYFGGTLGVLAYPMHGKPSVVRVLNRHAMFAGLEEENAHTFQVARYHSLYATQVPDCLEVTATTVETEVVMAIRHKTLPFAAVQFHPESILTSHEVGLQILRNQLTQLSYN